MYLTRNQAYRKVPWVRIPPSPPKQSFGAEEQRACARCVWDSKGFAYWRNPGRIPPTFAKIRRVVPRLRTPMNLTDNVDKRAHSSGAKIVLEFNDQDYCSMGLAVWRSKVVFGTSGPTIRGRPNKWLRKDAGAFQTMLRLLTHERLQWMWPAG